jgi:hypothetical protein
MLQTIPCVSDSWRNTIGSTGIAVVLAYCNSNPDLKDSDENCKEFANCDLEHLRFMYQTAGGDDHKVDSRSCFIVQVVTWHSRHEFKGAFRGAFILQTFVAHLTTIKGARRISGLDDIDTSVSRADGGLGLCAASVSVAIATFNHTHIRSSSNVG